MFFFESKNRRRQNLLQEPFPAEWKKFLFDNVRYYSLLDSSNQLKVQGFVRIFIAEKHWYGGEGQTITDEMKVTVAGQTALLILGLEEPYYFDRLHSIILFPAAFSHKPRESQSIFGNLKVLLGQAWYHSPIVLSWRDVLRCGHNESAGTNVVLHEFAHHLDGLDGNVDGSPPFVGKKRQEWYQVADAEYRRLVGNARRGESTLLDQYGASSMVEFFAVATECFFEQPRAMSSQHGKLYLLLQDLYQQDPAKWLPDAKVNREPTDSKQQEENSDADSPFDPPQWQDATIDDFFTMMVVYLNHGQYDLAERAASRALELDATDSELYQHRALARSKLGKFTEALQDCEMALEIDPEEIDAYRSRAAALIGLKQYEQAKEDLDRVLHHSGDNAEAYYLRGLVSIAWEEYKSAIADLSRSIWIRPLNADAYYQRAVAYQQLGREEEADVDRQKAFDLDPEVDRPIWLRRKSRK